MGYALMFGFFKRKAPAETSVKNSWSGAPLQVENSVFVIGDVHGMVDLLNKLLQKHDGKSEIIFVGDLIDRGDHSAQVVQTVFDLCQQGNARCILGNHEKMLLDFLDQPEKNGRRWLRYGGMQTVLSFGSKGATEHSSDADLIEAANDLKEKLGKERLAWLRALPTHIQNGNLWVVHAGANPHSPMDLQKDSDLIWGHPEFQKSPRSDQNWVMVGHTVVDQAFSQEGRIMIDTGSYATGVLTAAQIDDKGLTFVTT